MAMSQVLDFRGSAQAEKARLRVVPRGDEIDDFWPEPSSDSAGAAVANAPGRVLGEMAAVLSAVGLLILAVSAFVPGP
jgi:hypothetical protein